MNSRLQWGLQEINKLKDKYHEIVDVVDEYAKQNNYSFEKNTALGAFSIVLNSTLLREESAWSNTSELLSICLNILGALDIINDILHINRTTDAYVNNNFKLSSDLDKLYDTVTKTAMYTFYYVLAIYSKIKNENYTPFGNIDEIMCAINYGYRNQDTAKTISNNYIYDVYSAIKYFPKNYTFNNYYNWIRTGFICDTIIHSGK